MITISPISYPIVSTLIGNPLDFIRGPDGIDLKGTKVDVTKIMASDPRRVDEVVVEFYFPDKNYTEEEKKLVESVAGISPVPLSLHPDLKQTVTFNW